MSESYTLEEIKEKLEHEKYLRKENQELYEEKNRLNNIIKKLEQENAVLKTQVISKDKYSYGIRTGSDKYV